jgi:hypothetical protein
MPDTRLAHNTSISLDRNTARFGNISSDVNSRFRKSRNVDFAIAFESYTSLPL